VLGLDQERGKESKREIFFLPAVMKEGKLGRRGGPNPRTEKLQLDTPRISFEVNTPPPIKTPGGRESVRGVSRAGRGWRLGAGDIKIERGRRFEHGRKNRTETVLALLKQSGKGRGQLQLREEQPGKERSRGKEFSWGGGKVWRLQKKRPVTTLFQKKKEY